MKKLGTLFTTTMIALALMLAAPTAMAGNDKGNAKAAVAFCKSIAPLLDSWGITHGQCVQFFRTGNLPKSK